MVLMPGIVGDVVDDGNISADTCDTMFNHHAQPCTHEEREFLEVFTAKLEEHVSMLENGDGTAVTAWPDTQILETIDNIGVSDMHPAILGAYRAVIANPEKYGVDVENNNLVEQVIGQGSHDFTQVSP